jgi:hypothetical protein
MSRIRAIPNWPSSTRLLWILLASVLLSTLGVIGRHWLTYIYDTDYGPWQCNLVGLLAALVVFSGLAVLSWTEQRLHRALLEALIAATGWLTPILIDNAYHAVPTWLMVLTFFGGLVLFAVVRLISLAFVRIFLRKVVLSAAPL